MAASSFKRGYSLVDDPLLKNLEQWLQEALDAIRSQLGIDPLADRRAAWVAESLARRRNILTRWDVYRLLRGRAACCVAAGDCIELDALSGCEVVAVADSAVKVLLEAGLQPDVVFTDLDGGWEALRRASTRAVMVVHAHGDNAWLLSHALQDFPVVSVTVQTSWRGAAWTAPGFTDGDRMLATVLLAKPRSILLTGWCPDRPPHRLTGKRLNAWKRRKLTIADRLVNALLAYARLAGIPYTIARGNARHTQPNECNTDSRVTSFKPGLESYTGAGLGIRDSRG